METSRTKLRREVREKRLAYFEKSLSLQRPQLQEEATYHGPKFTQSPSKNLSKVRTKIAREVAGKDKNIHHQRQKNFLEGVREDGLAASGMSVKSDRLSSSRLGVSRNVLQYPQGPSGEDCANVTPLKRKNRPSSAIPTARGDHYRLDFADSARLTGNNLRPSSAKSGARPKRPQKDKRAPKTDLELQRPPTASVYRSNYENARRQSEFEDFRKGAYGSHGVREKTSEMSGRSDRELQDFFKLREIRQRSRNDLSPSSSESGRDAEKTHTYHFFRNQAESHPAAPENRLDREDLYGLRSNTSLEDGISKGVQSQWGSQAENEALQASEFHSAYSAENMLQSLLGIRKVKAKVHDELLSCFLENDDYRSILTRKRKSLIPRDESQKETTQNLNGNEVDMEQQNYRGGESLHERKSEEKLCALPSVPQNISGYMASQQEKQPDVSTESMPTNGGMDGNDSVSSNKDEGEESGVEMDDLSFDVGALCSAAKQGDDILRQYIRGLTERVKAKKGIDNNPEETVLEESSSRRSAKIESLFAPKMPERKFDEKITTASVSEKSTTAAAHLSSSPSYGESDSLMKSNSKSIFDGDQVNLQNDPRYKGSEGMEHVHRSANASFSTILAPPENQSISVQYSFECQDFSALAVTNSDLEQAIDDQKDANLEDKLRKSDQKQCSVEDSFQDENASVSKVREPAVTADLLEKLGLFDTKDTQFASPQKDHIQGSGVLVSQVADSSTDDVGIQLANGTLDDSDLGLETFRPDSRTISPLKEVRDYSKAGVLTTSHVESPDLIEEFLDIPTTTKPTNTEMAALRRTYDLSEDVAKEDFTDPNVNTPFHSHIQHSKYGVSFVFDPQDTGYDASVAKANSEINVKSQIGKSQGNSKHGVAFEVDLKSARKQPKPPLTSKPRNTRLATPSRGSPKHSQNSPQRSRPRKSPRTPDAHRDEVRHYHEKDRRLRKLSSPRESGLPQSKSSSTSDNQSSLRLNLPSNMDTDRPSANGIGNQDNIHDSISEVEFGAPFVHSPRHETPLEDENEVLDRIASFNPPGVSSNVTLETSESQDTVSETFGQHRGNFSEADGSGDSPRQRQESHMASRPRPSSANPRRTATKKPGNTRPTSAHSKMYSSPDKSYDRKWPKSSMAWMTQHKLTSSLLGGDESASDLTASGSKVKIGQSRVNREFARKVKPPAAVQMSKRDGQFVSVRSSKLFDGTVSRVLEGRGSAAVPPLTLQLIQDSPRGSESLSIWQLLPDEILLHIFSYLPQPRLVMCALTCQRFHRIAMDDSLWRTIRLENRDLTDFYLTHIGEKHPVSLTLHKCRGNLVTENGLRNLFRSCADSLQELNITGCSKGELQGDSILLHVSRCYNLISLDASWCAVTDNGLSAVLDGCPRLETICLNGCQSVSDQCLRQIVNKYGPNLQVLEMCGCFNLTPETLIHLAETSNQLTTLNIAQCYKISDECVASVAPKFQSLQHWHLKGCKELRDSSVKKIARHCKQLRTLSIASCPHITDVSLIEIATYLNSVRSLDVSGCRKVGNEGMRCLATCCPYLEKVGLSSTSVTHKSVSSLASYTSQTLMELKLNCCREITEASIIRLLKHCKKLKTLHLYGVKGLRNLGILKVQYPCIEYLEKGRHT